MSRPKSERDGKMGRDGGLSPGRPWLGQHFLRNRGVAEWMVRRAQVGPQDLALDIGAGDGALTLPLAARAGAVAAIECDAALAERLRHLTDTLPGVTVVPQDFLTWALPPGPFKVVANLPFGITTPVLRRLLDPRAPMARAVLLIERGAARRFVRCPSLDPEIIAWHTWFTITWERHVSPSSFVPPPRVDAAAVVLERRPSPDLKPEWVGAYQIFLQRALADPAIPLKRALLGIFTPTQLAKALRPLQLDRDAPVSSVMPTAWGRLYLAMRLHADPTKWPRARRPRRAP